MRPTVTVLMVVVGLSALHAALWLNQVDPQASPDVPDSEPAITACLA